MDIFKSYLNRYSGFISEYEPFVNNIECLSNFEAFTLSFRIWPQDKQPDPAKPALIFSIHNDPDATWHYFVEKRYAILLLNWRDPYELEICMRIEHIDTPRSKILLHKVKTALFNELRAHKCPDLINDELAAKINRMTIQKPDLKSFVRNLRSQALINNMPHDERSVDLDAYNNTSSIKPSPKNMEVSEDVPEKPAKYYSNGSSPRLDRIEPIYYNNNNTNDIYTPKASPEKILSRSGSSIANPHFGVSPIVISPDRGTSHSPAPAPAREILTRSPPRAVSPVHRPAPVARAPAAVTTPKKLPKQAAKKAPLEKLVGNSKRKKAADLIEEDPPPAAKKRKITPKQALKNFEEEEKALKKAMAIPLPHKISTNDALFIDGVMYACNSVTIAADSFDLVCEDDDSNYEICIPYALIPNMEIDDEVITFRAKVELLGTVKERAFVISGNNFMVVRPLLLMKAFGAN